MSDSSKTMQLQLEVFFWYTIHSSYFVSGAIHRLYGPFPVPIPPFASRGPFAPDRGSSHPLLTSNSAEVGGPMFERRDESLQLRLDELETGDSYFDTACRWLRGNSDRWVKWLPDKTKCFARYGLYHENKDALAESGMRRMRI